MEFHTYYSNPKIIESIISKALSPDKFNICYKIVSRAITKRLRPIMFDVINKKQSAFVPGRLITDSVVIGFECMHWIRNNTKN